MPGSPAMNSVAFCSCMNFVRHPVRKNRMSPDWISTPWRSIAASRSSGVMTSPACSQSTPLRRAMSSSTPRPAMPLAILSMRAVLGAVRADVARREAVVQLVVVEDVGQPVPLRRGLQRHEHEVVGVVEGAGELLVLPGLRHQPDRVDAPAAGLRAVAVERDAEVEDGAPLHQLGRRRHALRRDQVDGALLVVVAPAAPVAVALADLAEVLDHDVSSFAGGVTGGLAAATVTSVRTPCPARWCCSPR